jgi:hypothetical protein
MSYQTLTNFQKQQLWKLACLISQGPALYEEDHEYDDEEVKVIDTVEMILNLREPLDIKL